MQPELVPVPGKTYAIREELKAMGGSFDPDRKLWSVPADRLSEALKLLAEAGGKQTSSKNRVKAERKKREPLADAPELETLDAVLRGACIHLQNLVTYEGRWDDKTEDRIWDFARRVADAGGNTGWVSEAIERFKLKLKRRKSGRKLH